MPPVQQPTTHSSLPPQGVPTRMQSISSLHKAQDKPKICMAPTPAPAVLTTSPQQHQQCLWLQHHPCMLTTWLVHLLQHYKREVLTCPLLMLLWGDHHDQQLLQNWGPLSMLCRHRFCHQWIWSSQWLARHWVGLVLLQPSLVRTGPVVLLDTSTQKPADPTSIPVHHDSTATNPAPTSRAMNAVVHNLVLLSTVLVCIIPESKLHLIT